MQRHYRKPLALIVSGLFAAAALPASAADEFNSLLSLSLEQLIATPVITASRRAESREHTPAHILVYTREQIRDRRYKNLADLLEGLPGVDFQRGTRSAQYNNFVFQGHLSNNKLLILLDGVRIDHPAGGKIPIAENFSLHFAKQVEVLYGPAAALYGADAFAGVINIITDKAGDQFQGKVALGGGSYGSLEGDFLVGGALGRGFSLSASAHQQESDRAPLGQVYPDSYPKVAAGGISAAKREDYVGGIASQSQYLRLDHEDNLTVGFYRNRFRSLTSTGDNSASVFYLADAFFDTTIDTAYGKARFELAPTLKAELVVDYSQYQVDPQSRYLNKTTNFQNTGYDYAYAQRRGIEQNLNWQVGDDHALLAGVGYKDFYAIETPDLSRPYDTSRSPSAQGLVYPNTNLPLQNFEGKYYSWSGYLQWQAQWSPSFSTMVGARKDWYSTYGGSLNPRLGFVWQAAPGNYFKLLYGEAFRAPAPEDTYSAFGSFTGATSADGSYQGVGFRAPNYNLRPEKSKNLSLTWDWRPRKDFNLVTNAYLAHVTNVVTTQAGNSSTPCPFNPALLLGETQYIPGAVLCSSTTKANSGSDHYWGIDLIPQWKMPLIGAWTADLWGSYSYVRGIVKETDGGIEREQIDIAAHKLKLGVTFRYQDWLTVTPRVQWIGETNTGRNVSNTSSERIQAPSYTVASLHVGVHQLAGDKLSLYFDIYNLTDARYYNAHTSSSSSVLQLVPQQPRTYMGTLEYRF